MLACTLSIHSDLVASISAEIRAGQLPKSIAEAFDRLNPASLGLQIKTPTLTQGARLFRVRAIPAKPENIKEIGAPPLGVASMGRLNDQGQSVLYVADSPDTAFAEARVGAGEYCLAEWRIGARTIALANGGFDSKSIAKFFPNEIASNSPPLGGKEDHLVATLFADIFTLPVIAEPRMYWWSIACGLVNGFSHMCERTSAEFIDGNTQLTGRFPFAGIAYPSLRKDKEAANFAWNDLGKTYLELDHVQWVKREADGSFAGLDIATEWSSSGQLKWAGRAPHFVLQPGQKAKVVKISDKVWSYENTDGSLPTFC